MAAEPKSTLAIRAEAIVREHVLLSAGSALIPEPVLCTTAVTGSHVRMLDELSRLYATPFAPKAARAFLLAASGGVLTASLLRQPLMRRAIAAVTPWIFPIWFIGGSFLAGSLTHLLGHAFIRHYERGGTFADFDWPGFRLDVERRLKLRSAAPVLKPAHS